jgi:REP element-mobilizing transposase RayT
VINRGNARAAVFHKADDYRAFSQLLREATARVSMRLLAVCLLPNHFHLVLWPRRKGDLSRFMQWLLTAHVRRYHRHYRSSGHVWQGRFKAFPIQQDEHLLMEKVWGRILSCASEIQPCGAIILGSNHKPCWKAFFFGERASGAFLVTQGILMHSSRMTY